MKIKKFIETSPSFKIFTAISKINKSMQQNLKEVNFLQAMILLSLYFDKNIEIQPKHLAETLETSRSHISHNLSQLEGKKFIKRATLKNDARCFSLVLTTQGLVIVKQLVRYFDQLQKKTENLFSEEGTARLAKQIEKLADIH